MGRGHKAILAAKLANNVIQALLYNDRRDVQKRVNAAAADHQKHEVCKSVPVKKPAKYSNSTTPLHYLQKTTKMLLDVQVDVGIVGPLGTDVVAEANGREAHEAEVERLEVVPALEGSVERRGRAGDRARGQREVEHHPVDAWLPVLQTHLRVYARWCREVCLYFFSIN